MDRLCVGVLRDTQRYLPQWAHIRGRCSKTLASYEISLQWWWVIVLYPADISNQSAFYTNANGLRLTANGQRSYWRCLFIVNLVVELLGAARAHASSELRASSSKIMTQCKTKCANCKKPTHFSLE